MTLLRRLAAGFLGTILAGAAVRAGERVTFAAPARVTYELTESSIAPEAVSAPGPAWIGAARKGLGRFEQLGSRVVVGVTDTNRLAELLAGRPLTVDRIAAEGVYVLQAPDALVAARQASALALEPGVTLSHPVRRHAAWLHGAYAAAPADRYFKEQWHLENEPAGVATLGTRVDVNARSAWPITRGEGVLIGNADDGTESTHPDLAPNWAPELQMNFHTLLPNGDHSTRGQYHGTATAGIHSSAPNKIGGLGVAHGARFTSWVIFDSVNNIPDEEGMAGAFQYLSNSVPLQNHSWGNSDFEPLLPGTIELLAVSNAAAVGRNGRGTVFVRSAGNTRRTDYAGRSGFGDANVDGYANDPHAITVGGVAFGGRVASYSAPGACILVAAPGGDSSGQKIFTTDRMGTVGLNRRGTADDPGLVDYTYGTSGFYGTSAAAPVITGVAALVLSANPALGYRDVQQILLLSARQTDPADPDLRANGAGLLVSHNTGFGVPDAGVAVRLAKAWSNRPPMVRRTFANLQSSAIPDDGLRVEVTGIGVPPALASIPAGGSDGLHADQPTAALPLVDVGLADATLTTNLTGKAGLARRGQPVTFATKVGNIAQAKGGFAVVVNNTGTTEREIMRDLDFAAIPAVMVGHDDGEALAAFLATAPQAQVRLKLTSTTRDFAVNETLLCEHVGVRLRFNHDRLGDLRVTLRSPQGTLSVLHRPGTTTVAVPNSVPGHELPDELTYWSTHHFHESTAGLWTLSVSDEGSGFTGTVLEAELILHGVAIVDTDRDGLDDAWERKYFGNLNPGPVDDPDGDGYSNAREQVMSTNPTVNPANFVVEVTGLEGGRARLSWPGKAGKTYTVESAATADGPFKALTTVPSYIPESGLIVPYNATSQVFRVRE